MTVLDFQVIRDGNIVYDERDIPNTLHFLGEEFCLKCLFTGGEVPPNYYVGLDNRSEILATQTIEDLENEPVGNGYLRQAVSSLTGFSIEVNNGIHRAVSGIVTFSASGSGWGPVSNVFISNVANSSGYLVCSAKLSSIISLIAGDAVNLRTGMSLKYCP